MNRGGNRNTKMYMRNKFPLKMCVSVDSGRGGVSGVKKNSRENSFEVLENVGMSKLKNAFPFVTEDRKDSTAASELKRDFCLVLLILDSLVLHLLLKIDAMAL